MERFKMEKNIQGAEQAELKQGEPEVQAELRVLRAKEVAKKLGISIATLYDWLSKDSPRFDQNFPRPFKLSQKAVGWLSTEVDVWLLDKAANSRV